MSAEPPQHVTGIIAYGADKIIVDSRGRDARGISEVCQNRFIYYPYSVETVTVNSKNGINSQQGICYAST